MKTIEKLQKMCNKATLIACGVAVVLSASLFTACDLSEDDKASVSQTPTTNVGNTVDPQPISPEGKEIASLGEANGDVSAILSGGNLKIKSVGTGKGKFAAYKSAPKNYGTLIINITDQDLSNLAELEKTYESALNNKVTVYFESSKSNRKALNQVYVKLLGGTGKEKGLFAVMLQRFTDGSSATTPYCSDYNTDLKSYVCSNYNLPYSLDNMTFDAEAQNLKDSDLNKNASSSKTTLASNYTDRNIVDIANQMVSEEKDDFVYSIKLLTWDNSGYTVVTWKNQLIDVIASGPPYYAYTGEKFGLADCNISKSDSKTKAWSVGIQFQAKWKDLLPKDLKNKLEEIAATASGGYSWSSTEGFTTGASHKCEYYKNWMEYYTTTRNVEKARYVGDLTFEIKTFYEDLYGKNHWTTKNVTITYTGRADVFDTWKGVKPTTEPGFRYRWSGAKLPK